MSIYPTKTYPVNKGLSEFDILAASHKFLREDDDDNDEPNAAKEGEPSGSKTWEDRLAEKYYDNLYREFAVCDLKHYKSGNFALRWRTESEVISGEGESTCGNTRCKHHYNSSSTSFTTKRKKEPRLTTLELPFAYIEHGEPKNALVKVVLCPRCVRKLMWKRTKEKERADGTLKRDEEEEEGGVSETDGESQSEDQGVKMTKKKGKERERDEGKIEKEAGRSDSSRAPGDEEHRSRRHQQRDRYSRRRSSRSRSPHHSSSKNHNRTYDYRHSSYHK